jgi:signal peptide peptidase SppA
MDLKRFLPRQKNAPRVAVLRLDGAIGPSTSRLRGTMLNIHAQAARIERAFKIRKLSAVALVVNSPGGSAVQSALIASRIRALAEENDVPVFAFAEDAAASGGYWLACAGDEIYVNEASIVGSIGVISSGFGFQELISRYGIERRVYAAGENKAVLDPFLPERPEDIERLKESQSAVHDHFIAYVRARRGERLHEDTPDLFTGAFWTGQKAVELGLADAIGDVRSVMREKYGNDVRLVPVAERRSFLRSVFGRTRAPAIEADFADRVLTAVEERLIWSRLGL